MVKENSFANVRNYYSEIKATNNDRRGIGCHFGSKWEAGI
jgi:hypothetical protein